MHRLKDLGTAGAGLAAGPPRSAVAISAAASLDAFRHNLPVQLTPLVGRSGEIAEICVPAGGRAAGDAHRVGGGGQDPSRAGRRRPRCSTHTPAVCGGSSWRRCPIRTPSVAPRWPRSALMRFRRRRSPTSWRSSSATSRAWSCWTTASISSRSVPSSWPTCCRPSPSTSVLATSREPLGVPGEITWRVPSLRCPTRERLVSTSPALSQYDAVVLFVDRAHRARPSFAVSEANAPAIAQICHRLDGIPLAIELAAARCRQLSAERIAAELDDRFRLPDRRRPHGDGAPADPGRVGRLELRAARRRRADRCSGVSVCSPVRSPSRPPRRWSPRRGRPRPGRRVRPHQPPRRQEPRRRRRRRHGVNPAIGCWRRCVRTPLDRARAAGELTVLRDAHATWWADWLEPRGAMPTDDDARRGRRVPRQPHRRPRLERRPIRPRASRCCAAWAEPGRSPVGPLTRWSPSIACSPTTTPSATEPRG